METQNMLKLVFIAALPLAGYCAIFCMVRPYQIISLIALAALSSGVFFQYGLIGLVVVAMTVGVAVPGLVVCVSRVAEYMLWQGILKQFPEQPKPPPGQSLSMTNAWRLMWSL